MDKRKLMQSNVASILNSPAERKPASEEETRSASTRVAGFEARGRKRKPRTMDELTSRRNSVVEAWDKTKSYTTSFVFDYDQYVEMETIAIEHRISKKAALRELLRLGLEEYRRKGGF